MKATEIFKKQQTQLPDGQVLCCSKGGYRDDSFAYCISDDGKQFNVKVISAVLPRKYSVMHGPDASLRTVTTAILYNESKARVMNKQSLTANCGA